MYVPNFIPSDVPCVLPQYTETRSRNITMFGLFFRSKNCGLFNDLRVSCQINGVVTTNNIRTETFKVKWFENNQWSITHNIIQTINDTDNTVIQSGILPTKTLINTSQHIESPIKNIDVQDNGTEPLMLEPFDITLTGGTSGPSDDSVLNSIRTGPKYSLICVTSTEDVNGSNITPVNKIRYWTGTNWNIFGE